MGSIPKIIWQTCSSKYQELPEYVKLCSDSWKQNNEGWDYRYLTHEDCYAMLLENYDQRTADIYSQIDHPQIKADFWRYLTLYKFGGIYIDIDVISFEKIDSYITDKEAFFVKIGTYLTDREYEYAMWFFGCKPESPIIKDVIDSMMQKLNKLDTYKKASWQETGYPVWNPSIDKYTNEDWFSLHHIDDLPMHHYGANSKWTDNYYSRRPMETFFWDMSSSLDIKVSSKAYSSLEVYK